MLPSTLQWPADLCLVDRLAVTIKTELEEVGEDQVGKGMAVTLDLPAPLDVIKAFFGWIFGLNIADDVLLAVPDTKIRVPGVGLGKGG